VKLKLYYVVAIVLQHPSSLRRCAKRRSGYLQAKCAMCHGADGLGATPAGKAMKAASFKDPAVVKTPDAARIVIVKSGKNKMPAYAGKLTDVQITAVVAYIRTLEK